MNNLILNPAAVDSTVKDIIKQISYRYPKSSQLPKAIKNLSRIKDTPSWGNFASRATRAAKSLKGSSKDIIPHIQTRFKMFNDPIMAKQFGQEFVKAKPAVKQAAQTAPAAAPAAAAIPAALGTVGALATVGGAAALGAGAMGYNWYKHNKMLSDWNKRHTANYEQLVKNIQARKKSNIIK